MPQDVDVPTWAPLTQVINEVHAGSLGSAILVALLLVWEAHGLLATEVLAVVVVVVVVVIVVVMVVVVDVVVVVLVVVAENGLNVFAVIPSKG